MCHDTTLSPKKVLIVGREALTHNYKDALEQTGCIPVVSLSPDSTPGCPFESQYDGLLLPGGSDIDPALFGQLNMGSRDIDRELDLLQLAALDAFVKIGKPIFGICKGMQLINIYFSGTIIQNLDAAAVRLHAWDLEDKTHPADCLQGAFLNNLYGKEMIVNSAHHQGIGCLGECLRTAQTSRDGVIEGICHTFLPIIGVQWHPERMGFALKRNDSADGELLFRYFTSLL